MHYALLVSCVQLLLLRLAAPILCAKLPACHLPLPTLTLQRGVRVD
jgi:hypothetical protein